MTATDSTRHERFALVCLLGIVFVVGMLTLPALMYNVGDGYAVREESRAIVLEGHLSIDRDIAVNFPDEGAFFVHNDRNGNWYSRYGSFGGLFNAPPVLAELLFTGDVPPLKSKYRVLFLGIYYVCVAMGIAWVLWFITGFYTQSLNARMSFVLLAFYTTYLWNYLRSTSSESLQLLLLALTVLFFLRFKARPEPLATRPKQDLYLAWGALLLLCQTKISYLSIVPLFALMVWQLAAANGMRWAWKFLFLAIMVPGVILADAQATMQTIKFGSPLLSGYHQFHDPLVQHTFWEATEDFLWGPQGSIFIHFPLLLLAGFGLRHFVRRHGLETAFLWACFLVTFVQVARPGGPSRGELCYGPRYFVVFLPLLALPALQPLEWLFAAPRKRVFALGALAACAAFLVFVQMQINRLDFFFKYDIAIEPSLKDYNVIRYNPVAPAAMNAYFSGTNFAQINWDHIRCHGHWERLPYYTNMLQHMAPDQLQKWNVFVRNYIFLSNLYWFPGVNKW